MKQYLDILFKQTDNITLYLDIFVPDKETPPLIMWIHGGAWVAGDRKSPILKRQVERGYAVASIEYRLSGQATFPAQIIDCKDALWFLRQNASTYCYDPNRIAVAGDSAGGHLAALMGTSIGQADWEAEGSDCSVQAVIDYYGPTALPVNWENASLPDSPESKLLGVHVAKPLGRAKAAVANPITYINGSEPPFLIIHGDKDDIVPFTQSIYLRNALEEAGSSVAMHRVHGAGHGFDNAAADAIVDAFLDYHLYTNGKSINRLL